MNEIIETFGKIVEGGLGFRFLFSKTYRDKTRQRWRNQSKTSIVIEVFETMVGVAFIIIIFLVIVGIMK